MSTYQSNNAGGTGCAGCVVQILVLVIPLLCATALPIFTDVKWWQGIMIGIGFAVVAHATLQLLVEVVTMLACIADPLLSPRRKALGVSLAALYGLICVAFAGSFVWAAVALDGLAGYGVMMATALASHLVRFIAQLVFVALVVR